MNCRTYEQYDENEYFLKYLNIHPWILYSIKKNDINKKNFQYSLLDKFNKEIITYDELKKNYQLILNIERSNKQLIADLQYKHKMIEEQCEEIINNNIDSLYQALMK